MNKQRLLLLCSLIVGLGYHSLTLTSERVRINQAKDRKNATVQKLTEANTPGKLALNQDEIANEAEAARAFIKGKLPRSEEAKGFIQEIDDAAEKAQIRLSKMHRDNAAAEKAKKEAFLKEKRNLEDRLHRMREHTKKQIDASLRKRKALERTGATKDARIAQLQTQLSDAEADITRKDQQIQQAVRDLRAAEASGTASAAELATHVARIEELARDLGDREAALEAANNELDAAKAELEGLRAPALSPSPRSTGSRASAFGDEDEPATTGGAGAASAVAAGAAGEEEDFADARVQSFKAQWDANPSKSTYENAEARRILTNPAFEAQSYEAKKEWLENRLETIHDTLLPSPNQMSDEQIKTALKNMSVYANALDLLEAQHAAQAAGSAGAASLPVRSEAELRGFVTIRNDVDKVPFIRSQLDASDVSEQDKAIYRQILAEITAAQGVTPAAARAAFDTSSD